MTEELQIGVEGQVGVIALNRPQAINALSREMIRGITECLTRWRDNPDIAAVLFEGRGPRGFCAGGDVRAVRQLILDGRPEDADSYFAEEYAMNALITTYLKPTIALVHGVVMGGGIGIAGHCRYRITLPDARFAMPEAAIGFVADVGVNAILSGVPLHRALLFLMSGVAIGAADALALGLVDCAVLPERLAAVRDGVVAAAAEPDIGQALVRLLEAESIQAGDRDFVDHADTLAAQAEVGSAAELLAAIGHLPATSRTATLLQTLRSRCPTSLEAIYQGHLASRALPGVEDVLQMELRLAGLMGRRADFAEGVRAVLVDKDQSPRWSPATLDTVDREAIAAAVAPPTT